MTYVRSNDEIDAKLEADFDKVVGPEFRAKLESMTKKAAEEFGYELECHLSYMLEQGNLSSSILSAAQRMASDFIESVQRGDDKCVEQFLGQPNNDYIDERKKIRGDETRKYGGLELRQRLVECVQDKLENEVIKDLQAEVEVLRKELLRDRAELIAWRTGKRVIEAPEMHEALREAHDVLHKTLTAFVPSNDGAYQQISETMSKIRATLIKAEGRS